LKGYRKRNKNKKSTCNWERNN